jgi:UTP--glucose-1-phosphate uridylyltransferase
VIKKAVIPAAGLGTRFLPATKAQPKEMLPIIDKPVIQFVVEEAIASGIDDILIITQREKRAIENHFDASFELESYLKDRDRFDLLNEMEEISNLADIHYIRQKEPRGLGDAIYRARKHIDGPFAVLLGDDIIRSDIPCTKQLADIFDRRRRSIIGVEEVPIEKISDYGMIKGRNVEGLTYLVEDLVEKPSAEEAPSNIGIVGRYILTPEIFDCILETPLGIGDEVQLTDALRILNKREEVYAYKFNGKRYDIGDKLGYIKATIDLALEREDLREEVERYLKSIVDEGKYDRR